MYRTTNRNKPPVRILLKQTQITRGLYFGRKRIFIPPPPPLEIYIFPPPPKKQRDFHATLPTTK